MRPPLIAGNWKMNGRIEDSRRLARALKEKLGSSDGPETLVCPPFLSLTAVREELKETQVRLGAQDVHWEAKGAFTGEVSCDMLRDAGCTHVVIGHSERRHIMGETHEMVNRKTKAVLAAGMTPIVCVGELLEERTLGDTRNVIERQLTKGLEGLTPEQVDKLVIAYEPVWAIGTGKTATPRQAQEVHHFVRKLLGRIADPDVAARVRVLYGGSVKADNIKDLMAEEDIDGALVGGASLDADSFAKIARYGS